MTLTRHILHQGGINVAGSIRGLAEPSILAVK